MVSNTVFISYSHRDAQWLERLQVHLKPLEKQNLIDLWDDKRIKAGAQWKKEISKALAKAKVAILLISADFLASDFIVDNELPPLLQSAKENNTRIIPIIISASPFDVDPYLSEFQALNDPNNPIVGMKPNEQEDLFSKVSKIVRDEFLKELPVGEAPPSDEFSFNTDSGELTLNIEFSVEIEVGDAEKKLNHKISIANQPTFGNTPYNIYYLVHESDYDAPVIIGVVECSTCSLYLYDVDKDGFPEVLIEYTVGAHTHVLEIFKFSSSWQRPTRMEGGPIGADGAVIRLSDEDGDGIPEIYAALHAIFFLDELDEDTRRRAENDEGGFYDIYKIRGNRITQVGERQFLDLKNSIELELLYNSLHV